MCLKFFSKIFINKQILGNSGQVHSASLLKIIFFQQQLFKGNKISSELLRLVDSVFWIWITCQFDEMSNSRVLYYGWFDGDYHKYVGFITLVGRSQYIKWYVSYLLDKT